MILQFHTPVDATVDVKMTVLQVVSRPFAFVYSLFTSVKSAAIAMGAAAAVILFSSRSFVLTLFATVTVGYVLTSVTALLVAAGWTLGFLESILFAILIGISCDFVVRCSKLRLNMRGLEATFTYYFSCRLSDSLFPCLRLAARPCTAE